MVMCRIDDSDSDNVCCDKCSMTYRIGGIAMTQLVSPEHLQAKLAAYDVAVKRCQELEHENVQLKQRIKRLCCLLKIANERIDAMQCQLTRRNNSGASHERRGIYEAP